MAKDAQVNPRQHDEAEAKLFEAQAKAERELGCHIDRMHRMARDKKEFLGHRQVWRMTHAQVIDQLRFLVIKGDDRDLSSGMTPTKAMAEEGDLRTVLARIAVAINEAEAIYLEHRWTRWFPCLNRDGHIHSSLRNCPSVRWDTLMGWTPELSGKSIEVAVAELGEALCTICFPLAPVAWTSKTLGQVERDRTRTEREAAKSARDAAKNAKRLADNEVFRTRYGRDRVETVAACKDLIRKPIETAAELAWVRALDVTKTQGWTEEFKARRIANAETDYRAQILDADDATAVLIAREAKHEGWGATLPQIEKIITAKKKAATKAWATA